MSLTAPIFTAVVFRNGDEDDNTSSVTEPLMEEIVVENGEKLAEEEESERRPRQILLLVGIITGFLIQVVSLGAYAVILLRWGEKDVQASEADWFLYAVLSVLTQVDLCIYVMIWFAFTCTMTRTGMAIIRDQCEKPIKRRSVFFLGVFFLIGVVLGAFLAWTAIDTYLGFPIPFLPIVATVFGDLVLCYLMIWCYDFGKEETIEDEDETACC